VHTSIKTQRHFNKQSLNILHKELKEKYIPRKSPDCLKTTFYGTNVAAIVVAYLSQMTTALNKDIHASLNSSV